MRVIRISPAGRAASTNPIFIGKVDMQTVVGEESRDLRLTEVHFRAGAVNRPHLHPTDQILLVTEGEGIVAGDGEEHVITVGDVAFIPANTRHWHGARPGKDMTHLSILGPGTTTIAD